MWGVSVKSAAHAQSGSALEARVEAERAGGPFLIYKDGEDNQKLFVFAPDAAQASVGRRPPSDLLLGWDDQVSRLHARFERVADGWEVSDDGLSRNGTFLNGERVSAKRRLTDGDTLRFGTTTVTFRSPQPDQAAPGHAAPPAAAVSLSSSQRRVLISLCRPYAPGSEFASPASDEQIAEELFLSVAAVRTHIRVLCAKLGVEQLPVNEARVRLVERAFSAGLISERDL